MAALRSCALLACVLLACGCRSVGEEPFAALIASAAATPPREVAVAYRDLGDGTAVSVAGDLVVHAASTMKVPVMIEAFRRAERGELDLDGGLVLRNEFRSVVDGSPFALDPAEDSDPELYGRLGERVPVLELVRRMIVRSSNLATNALIDVLGADRVQATIEALGVTRMQVRRGVEDDLAFRAGIINTATADDLATLLVAIAGDRAASPASCSAMRGILEAQELDELIPAGLPPGTRVAHKTGSITAVQHDAAIVYPDGLPPFVLVVLTRGFQDEAESAAAIRAVARAGWADHARRTRGASAAR
jgi:beta-lactamase class A